MSAQPKQAPAPPAPAAAQLRADRRADTWVLAFERDWAKALEDSRHSSGAPSCDRRPGTVRGQARELQYDGEIWPCDDLFDLASPYADHPDYPGDLEH
ncbi:hypothetical protein [Streptomyces sp. SLBN-115]|uniref:hypothetical protein n=1 Tax=Streptomyces sp. SLBN-115 TaxID=2768453 RepID=UPI001173148D|nr:hypothetical protein [Streptomyces sp. SLBN-115]TQJ37701.1 hypothetical protein FBY34_7841 [Streptomyces sp. SLBN-115]